MGPKPQFRERKKIDKTFLRKNKGVKLFKGKQSKIGQFQNEVMSIVAKYEQLDTLVVEKFADFPLSYKTQKGLNEHSYFNPTEIQIETIGLALKGKDILGAAKTGSGKTLAFVVPVLERLYCLGWSILDGLGAVIITPTRELAYQIFEVLNKVGSNHHFSVALVIGGKDIAKERKLLDKCNILICTPGRLLQHMDENPLFDAMNMKILVLDEADRILDLGFEKAMNAILENFPPDRQTLLFSATQTKSVKDLARLSLKNPVYVSVHEHAKHITPEGLQQSYLACEAHDKMNLLWSFIKSHKQQKILVFMASCKQVKFTYESFCRLRPGVSLMALYGSLNQLRRMEIYNEFSRKNHVVMFATDVASRGLDFPNVNWVVQLDCPEDVNTYIHRAGRTARFEKGGEALLVLLPTERDSMIEQLQKRKIPIEEIKANPSKLYSIQRKLEAILARDVNLKDSGLRGFKAYLKNIFLMKDKSVFDVTSIDSELYAKSLGLPFAPRIRFLEKHLKAIMEKNSNNSDFQYSNKLIPASRNLLQVSDESDDDGDSLLIPKKSSQTHMNQDSEEDDVKDLVSSEVNLSKKPLTKAALAKRVLKKKIKPNTITKFDEDGAPIRKVCGQVVPMVAAEIQKELLEEGYSIEKAKLLKEKEDEVDKILYKEKIKIKHRGERLKLKQKRLENRPEGVSATLDNTGVDDGPSGRGSGSENDIDPNNMGASSSESDEEDGRADESDEEDGRADESEDDNSEESDRYSEDDIPASNKRRVISQNKKTKRQKIETEERNPMKVERNIEDDEQLALHFLSNT